MIVCRGMIVCLFAETLFWRLEIESTPTVSSMLTKNSCLHKRNASKLAMTKVSAYTVYFLALDKMGLHSSISGSCAFAGETLIERPNCFTTFHPGIAL